MAEQQEEYNKIPADYPSNFREQLTKLYNQRYESFINFVEQPIPSPAKPFLGAPTIQPPTPTSVVNTVHVLKQIYLYNSPNSQGIPLGNFREVGYINPLLETSVPPLEPSEERSGREIRVILVAEDGLQISYRAVIFLKRFPPSSVPGSFTSGSSIFTAPAPSSVVSGSSVFTSRANVPNLPDFNKDGVVNDSDRMLFVNQYGKKGDNLPMDINRDGIIDGIDYNMWLKQQVNSTP